LLGDHEQSALTGAVAKFTGLGQSGGQSLLSLLTPAVMGLIGRQLGPRLDASSLTGLFTSQKEAIAQALPLGMGKLLGGTGLLDSLAGATGSVSEAAAQTGRATAAATDQVAQFASSAARSARAAGQRTAHAAISGTPNWIYWVVPLVVIAGLLWYLFGNQAEQVSQQAVVPVQRVVVGSVDVGKQIGDSLGDLRASLQGISDVASATEALPKLQATAAQIDKVNSAVEQLSADQRKFVGGLVTPAMTTINPLLDKVLAIHGVDEVVKPTIDSLKAKLANLSEKSTTVGAGR
jgi:hypothetical protein